MTGVASAVTAEVAKKCEALRIQKYPPREPGNPAAGSASGDARAQQSYFDQCVANAGNEPNQGAPKSRPKRATPYLIGDIEMTCRQLILDHADANEDSVGMEVAIKHLAPTLPGSTVEIAVTVTAIEGRKVSFAVTAKDEIDTISTGSHVRFVVDKAKTIERLKAKAAKLRPA
jgi:predicted thioesterase